MTDQYDEYLQIAREHFGSKVDGRIAELKGLGDLFSRLNIMFFGEVYGDKDSSLDQRTREIATIAALTVQGFSIEEVKLHINTALNCGVTKKEIIDIITQMVGYCGFPAVENALKAAKEVFSNHP